MPGPQRQTQDEYLDGFVGGLTGGSAPAGGVTAAPSGTGQRYQDVGNDNGGPGGGPGSRGRGNGGATEVTTVNTGNFYDTSADSVAAMLAGMPPEKVADIQRKMVAIGLLPASFSTFGFVDGATRTAFTELLDYTNRDPQGGDRWDNTLDGLATSGTSMAEAEVEAAKMTQRQQAELNLRTRAETFVATDPASVRQLAEAAFRSALGRKPKGDEMQKFVSTFMSSERGNFNNQVGLNDQADQFGRDQALASATRGDAATAAASGGGSESDQLWAAVNQMIADSPYAGRVSPGPRTRSYEDQVAAKEREKAGGPKAATPGTSKHGDGRANDIQGINNDPEIRRYFHENAARYGLHFPLYDPSLPRANNEAWHVELKGGHSTGDGHNHGGGSAGAPPLSRTFTAQGIDPAARATEQIRKDNPVEVGAYDIGTQFNEFMSIMSRSVV